MNIARLGNKYLADKEPWKLQKTDPEAVKPMMAIANCITASLGVLCAPFLPETSKKLIKSYAIDAAPKDVGTKVFAQQLTMVTNPGLLFQKIEDEQVYAQVKQLEDAKPKNTHMPQKETIAFEDFTKLDLRVGEVISAEKVEKADKLLCLKIDTGLDVRTVVSGIAEYFSPEEVLGKKVTLLLNLAPRKIRGIASEGMILMAEDDQGLHFLTVEEALKGSLIG